MGVCATAVFLAWCWRLVVVDIREHRLPNRLTGAGAIGVLGYAASTGSSSRAVLGGALLAALYLAVHLAAPAAFGAGDVKLAVGLGAVAAMDGAQAWVWSALLAPLSTAVVGLAVLGLRGNRSFGGTPVPHGPSMCAATVFALVVS